MTPGKRSRFIKRSHPRHDPERVSSSRASESEFVVLVVIVILRGERESLGKTDRYPKCRLAGLRAGMQCEPAITATRCHPEEGNFVWKVHYAPRPVTRSEKRAAFLLFDDHAPPSYLRSLLFSLTSFDHVLAARLFRHRPMYNRAQSIRTDYKVFSTAICRAFGTRQSSDLFFWQ